jgi:hypothetical protein
VAAPPIAHSRIHADLNPARCLSFAQRELGKGYFAQVREILGLSRGVGKLTPREYFLYGLYDDRRLGAADKGAFLGQAALDDLDKRILRNPWHHIAADKLVLYALLEGFAVPTPPILAVWHRFRRYRDAQVLRSDAEAARFLRQATYPLFAKPVQSVHSLGTAALERYDVATDSLVIWGGATVPLDRFVAELQRYVDGGYLFQERIRPDPALAALTGNRISSLRVYVIVGENGPEILRAGWKIAVGDNPADNYWRPGNLLGAVDVASGEVQRVVSGFGPDLVECATHPDTGARLVGTALPGWDRLRDRVLMAASSLPGCRLQGWDVALADSGPLVIELEGNGGHPQLVQLAHGTGLYSGRFKEFYDRHRLAAKAAAQARRKRHRRVVKAA